MKLADINDERLREIKSECLSEIRSVLPRYRDRALAIDERLWDYACGVVREDKDVHNVYEILGLRKFLRMMDTYVMNDVKTRKVLACYEKLEFSGLKGRRRYKLTPIQVIMMCGVMLFTREVQSSKRFCSEYANNGKGGEEDFRRIVTDAVFFIVRKFCKTTMGAFFAFWFFMFEDYNSEIYCVANSGSQSKLLYNMARQLLSQIDPDDQQIRKTSSVCQWRQGQQREAKIEALTAGGKTKDGLFAQLCLADEFGSAAYVNEKSDLGQLVSVVEGSMGPRREPLSITMTTAGRISSGPFIDKLEKLRQILIDEMNYPLDGEIRPSDSDWQYSILMCPDAWEQDEESCKRREVWEKCNPHIGITVQPDFYESEWKKMEIDDEKKRENLCKLFNVYQSDRVVRWIRPAEIQKLMKPMTIDRLDEEDGWVVFIGQDFSRGDDMCGQSYLCVREGEDGYEFFADMDAWVSELSLRENPNRLLYQQLVDDGYLRVSTGQTIDENLVLARNMEIAENLRILKWGYDAYDAMRFVNSIGAWLQSAYEVAPETMMRPVSQTFASYNSPVQELEYMVRSNPPLITFSNNPLWPWQFGNCMLEEDKYENRKPLKMSANRKVDNIQCLLSALKMFDEYLMSFNSGK